VTGKDVIARSQRGSCLQAYVSGAVIPLAGQIDWPETHINGNMLTLTFYQNSQGVHIGDLHQGDRRLLATTHPATIAAAIFAMDEYDLEVKTDIGSLVISFPIEISDLDPLGAIMEDQAMGDFMSGFATFSRFDFANPLPYDPYAEIHFRAAVHHLPKELVKVSPSMPAPKSFKKDLRERNKYIYFPWE
jgi:hypothetical protein